MILKFFNPFLVAFLASVILLSLSLALGKFFNWTNGRVGKRHVGSSKVMRFGGSAIILSFLLSLFIDPNLVFSPELCGFVIASLLILVFGVMDDIKEIFWKFQLFFQILVSTLVFIFGVRIYFITNPLNGGILNLDSQIGVIFSVLLVIFWITLVMNAMNWIDGIDGLSGGISFVATVTIFILSLKPEVNQPPIAIITAALAGSILGFLIFNFHPSRILAGTSGSMFLGFALATLAIFSGAKIATSLLVLSIPILDMLWVVFKRMHEGKSIFSPDMSHLHHRLLSLGWPQMRINLVFLAITVLIAFAALNTRAIGKGVVLAISVIIMGAAFFLLNKKIGNRNNDSV